MSTYGWSHVDPEHLWTRQYDPVSECVFFIHTSKPKEAPRFALFPPERPMANPHMMAHALKVCGQACDDIIDKYAEVARQAGVPADADCGPRSTEYAPTVTLRRDEVGCARWMHVGVPGDGGREICETARLATRAGRAASGNCVVYSFGTAAEWSFDSALREYGCSVHGFDPSVDAAATAERYNAGGGGADEGEGGGGAFFHPWGMGPEGVRMSNTHGPPAGAPIPPPHRPHTLHRPRSYRLSPEPYLPAPPPPHQLHTAPAPTPYRPHTDPVPSPAGI